MSLQTWHETLVNSSTDGSTLTAAAAASCIPAKDIITLPGGNFWQIGKMLRIRAHGRISSVITTPGTARFDVRLTGTVVWDSLAILLDTAAAATNIPWDLEILLTCRSVGTGTSATLMGVGRFTSYNILGTPATPPKGALSAVLPWNTAPVVGAGFNSLTAHTLDLFFTQTVATGSLTVHQYMVESLN